MTPDSSLEARVSRLAMEAAADRRDIAALTQRMDSLEHLVAALAPLVTQTAVLAANVGDLDQDVKRVEGKFDKRLDVLADLLTEERKTREKIREEERAETQRMRDAQARDAATERRWRIGLAVVILLGVLGAMVSAGVAVIG